MEVSIQLGKLLGIDEVPHGLVQEISGATGIPQFTVRQLLHNRAKSIKLDHLARLCKYLIEHRGVDPSRLPGALFECRPDQFWPLLASRNRIEICMGVRKDEKWRDQLVMAADSQLQAKVVEHITRIGRDGDRKPSAADMHYLDLRLVPAPGRGPEGRGPKTEKAVQRAARQIYAEFGRQGNDKALVCLGSIKSNPVMELVAAHCFANAKAFQPEDGVWSASDRSCPFLILYRNEDPQPTSLCGGTRLSSQQEGCGPGIYYEEPGGSWVHCPWNKQADAALVFYRFRKPSGNLEMVLGGFSSRATRALAAFLGANGAEKLWPPGYTDSGVEIGLFVVRFAFEGTDRGPRGDVRHYCSAPDVISLNREVIEHRLKPAVHVGDGAPSEVPARRTPKPR